MPARQVVELGHRVMRHLVVVFHLVGDLGHARAGDRAHVVIPPVDPLARFAPVGRPAEIGGVDVGGQPLLEPVQLVGADEMHLAGQAGVIARPAQVMRVAGDGGGELGGVVVDPRARGQLPRHEARPPRRAEGARRIGVGKADRPFCQALEVGRVQPVGRPVGEQRAVQLIDHQHQDVGPPGHRSAPVRVSVGLDQRRGGGRIGGAGAEGGVQVDPVDHRRDPLRHHLGPVAPVGRSAWRRFETIRR
jgi:hypothetical protein